MGQEIAAEPLSYPAQLQAFLDAAWPRNPLADPRVRYWQVARRSMLLVLLAFSGMQYYYFDVYLAIMALPRLTAAAALP